jgi:hypothetical protein
VTGSINYLQHEWGRAGNCDRQYSYCSKYEILRPEWLSRYNDKLGVGGFGVRTAVQVIFSVPVAGLLASSQYPEGHATGHLGTGFSWFPWVSTRMLRWFPRRDVASACCSCSPPELNFLDPYFIFMYMHNNHCHRTTAHWQLNKLLLLLLN